MTEQSQSINPYVSEVQATARSGFAVRAPAPILIQQQRRFTDFLFQIDDTDDLDSDVLVEMVQGKSGPNGRSGNSRGIALIDLHAFDFES